MKIKVQKKIRNKAFFEPVSAYAAAGLPLPERKTAGSAGYDFVVAEDTIVPSYEEHLVAMINHTGIDETKAKTLEEVAKLTKEVGARPTLVPTGMKCYLPKGTYLELSVRSSCPLKHWLVLANGSGKIDSDYYNNPDNEGAIYFQLINLSPWPILLKKGDIIGQGIITPYLTTANDTGNTNKREGGFGSTSNG